MHTFKIIWSFLTLSFLLFPKVGFSQHTKQEMLLTLQDAIALAKTNNISARSYAQKIQLAEGQQKIINQQRLPQVDLSAAYARLSKIAKFEQGILHDYQSYAGPDRQYHLSLEAEFPIYTGGRIKAHQTKSKIHSDITKLSAEYYAKQLHLSIIHSFLAIQYLGSQKNLFSHKMQEDSLLISQVQKLKDQGKVTKNEVLRAKLQWSNHHMSYKTIQNDILIAEHRLASILDLPDSISLHIVDLDLNLVPRAEENSELALNNFSVLKHENIEIARKNKALTQQDYNILQSELRPQIHIKGQYGLYYPNMKFYPSQEYLYGFGMLGLNVQYSLSNLYTHKDKKQVLDTQLSLDFNLLSYRTYFCHSTSFNQATYILF